MSDAEKTIFAVACFAAFWYVSVLFAYRLGERNEARYWAEQLRDKGRAS